MKRKYFAIWLITGIMIFTASACGSIRPPGAETEPTPLPPVVSDIEIVAEGRIVPNEDVNLSFFTSGQIEEVLVEEGDPVTKGQVLARLGNREELEASIANAESELLSAKQAYDQLFEDNEIKKAEALKKVTEANRDVRDARYTLDNFTVPTNMSNLETMAAINVMRERVDRALERFEPYRYKSSTDQTRQDRKEDLEEAQSDYNTAVRRLEYESAVDEAQARLDDAMEELQTLQDGPDPDDIAAADARIKASSANLESAQVALEHLDLIATINGTVVKEDLIMGQEVTAGQSVIQIADFSKMYAETDDLTEIEVVDISIGQNTLIEPDALPGVELDGKVENINQVYEEKRGDITYTTRILIENFDPRLRWGMTVLITFLEE